MRNHGNRKGSNASICHPEIFTIIRRNMINDFENAANIIRDSCLHTD